MQKEYPTIVLTWRYTPEPITTDALAAVLSDLVNLGWSEEPLSRGEGSEWRVYFEDSATAARGLDAVRAFVAARGLEAAVLLEHVTDRDWMEAFREFFHTTRVPPCWWIAPPWEADDVHPASGEHLLIVHPGMAFGTGLHETTRLCLEFIAEQAGTLTRVLDVGAGSGVLSVASVRLGTERVEAFEINAMAAENLRYNLELNHVQDRVRVHHQSFSEAEVTPAPVVICNMERQHFGPVLPALCAALAPDGLLFASGFFKQGRVEVESLFEQARLRIVSPRRKGDWLGYVLQHAEFG